MHLCLQGLLKPPWGLGNHPHDSNTEKMPQICRGGQEKLVLLVKIKLGHADFSNPSSQLFSRWLKCLPSGDAIFRILKNISSMVSGGHQSFHSDSSTDLHKGKCVTHPQSRRCHAVRGPWRYQFSACQFSVRKETGFCKAITISTKNATWLGSQMNITFELYSFELFSCINWDQNS